MVALPSGWRLAGLAFMFAMLFAMGGVTGWIGGQPIAGVLSALLAVALVVRGVLVLVRLQKLGQGPASEAENDETHGPLVD